MAKTFEHILLFDQNDNEFTITNKTNDMERTLIGSKVKANIKGLYVTVGYICSARLRSKHGKLFYGDIVLEDKYSKFQEINVIGHDYNYDHALEGKRAKIVDIVTYIEGIE